MGTFLGHAANGTFFVVYALIWMMRYAGKRDDNSRSRFTRIMARVPLEGLLVLIPSVALIIGENMHPYPKWKILNSDGTWANYAEVWQHCTMAMFFATYGIVNIVARTCYPSAARYEMLFGALAFGVEGTLFYFHSSRSTNELEARLHQLLLLPVFGCFFSTLAEALRNTDPCITLVRIVCTLLQGTWLWQIALSFFPPAGEPWGKTPLDLQYCTIVFCWHILVDVIVLCVVSFGTRLVRRVWVGGKTQRQYTSLPTTEPTDAEKNCFEKLLETEVKSKV